MRKGLTVLAVVAVLTTALMAGCGQKSRVEKLNALPPELIRQFPVYSTRLARPVDKLAADTVQYRFDAVADEPVDTVASWYDSRLSALGFQTASGTKRDIDGVVWRTIEATRAPVTGELMIGAQANQPGPTTILCVVRLPK